MDHTIQIDDTAGYERFSTSEMDKHLHAFLVDRGLANPSRKNSRQKIRSANKKRREETCQEGDDPS